MMIKSSKKNFELLTTLVVLFVFFTTHFSWAEQPPQIEISKKDILIENNLYQITEVLDDGKLIIDTLAGSWEFLDDRFRNVSTERIEQIRGFLLGKFIKIPFPKINSGIALPAELYNPLCFAADPQQRKLTDQCPVILKQ